MKDSQAQTDLTIQTKLRGTVSLQCILPAPVNVCNRAQTRTAPMITVRYY